MTASGGPVTLRPLGTSGLEVTALCVGTSPLASMAGLYGYEVGEERAVQTVLSTFRSPISFLDTSNGYGEDGTAEKRIGEAIRRAGGLPPGMVLATKIDPPPGTLDFSGARVRASLEESLERLGVDHLPLLYLHDPERIPFAEGSGPGGALETMVAIRGEGLVDNIGVAGGTLSVLQQYLDTGQVDVVLNHNRLTLLDRSAAPLFAGARSRGVGVVNAAPYGGGMLSKGPRVQQNYAYGARDEVFRVSAEKMQQACARYGLPLAAAALQYSLYNPLVDSTVVGVSSPERIQQTMDLATVDVPDALWEELDEFVPPEGSWLT